MPLYFKYAFDLIQAEIAKPTMPTELKNEISLEIEDIEVVLRSDGTICLPEFRSLLVADLHLGKDASFRAAGFPVPEGPNQTTFDLLNQAIAATRPGILFLLGDLIHNRDAMTTGLIQQFAQWRTKHSNMRCVLVRGNHDRHVKTFPATWQMEEVFEYRLGPFELVHEVAAAFSTSRETSGRGNRNRTTSKLAVIGIRSFTLAEAPIGCDCVVLSWANATSPCLLSAHSKAAWSSGEILQRRSIPPATARSGGFDRSSASTA